MIVIESIQPLAPSYIAPLGLRNESQVEDARYGMFVDIFAQCEIVNHEHSSKTF